MSSLLGLERQQRRFLKIHFEFAYFSFFLSHLELNWYNPVSSPENHTAIPDQNRESLYPFSDQNAAKPSPTFWGGTYPYGLYRGVPPGALNQGRSLKASVTHLYLN